MLLAVLEALTSRKDAVGEPRRDDRLITNFGLTAIVILCGSLLPLANVGSSALAKGLGLGLTRHVAMPTAAVFALTLIGQTFAGYWVHRALHASPLLWRLHRVHHADTQVDVSTSLRGHPLELLIATPVSALVVLLIGAPVAAVVVTQTVFTVTTIWTHADIGLSHRLDRTLTRVIVTPRLHRLHHSPDRSTHDSNFGGVFVIWDWLFGTLILTEGRGRVGLNNQPIRPHNLLEQICSPFYPLRSTPRPELNSR